jgi:hypothetical protein
MLDFRYQRSRRRSGGYAMHSITELLVIAGIVIVLFAVYGGKLVD